MRHWFAANSLSRLCEQVWQQVCCKNVMVEMHLQLPRNICLLAQFFKHWYWPKFWVKSYLKLPHLIAHKTLWAMNHVIPCFVDKFIFASLSREQVFDSLRRRPCLRTLANIVANNNNYSAVTGHWYQVVKLVSVGTQSIVSETVPKRGPEPKT